MQAAIGGHRSVVVYLIEQELADINAQSTPKDINERPDVSFRIMYELPAYGHTALMLAVKGNHLPVVEYLARKGANMAIATVMQTLVWR